MRIYRAVPAVAGATLALLVLVAVAASRGPADEWPGWRGLEGTGQTAEPSGWKAGAWPLAAPVWQADVGVGAASVAVAGGRLYTIGWREGRDTVVCLDTAAGREVWRQSYAAPAYGRHHAGDESWYQGSLATPTLDLGTGLLYTLGADGDLNCWDTTAGGQRVWGLNLYDTFGAPQRPDTGGGVRDYGYTTAPLVYRDWLLVVVGAPEGTLVAFDRRSGKRVWSSAHRGPAGHCGGLTVTRVGNIPCVVTLTLTELVVIRLDEGHVGQTLATYPWQTAYGNNIASPAVQGDSVILTSDQNLNRTVRLRIAPGQVTQVWESTAYSGVCTPVVVGGYVYMASGELMCLDLATGKLLWSGG
ncbi:MAG: PQQ-binding-like beta-propeller repeat protein [Armatimonadetes bacterium]|nr:PQQ-binding-like beta-propeller repeat protein [Armatimonadota bacterium]